MPNDLESLEFTKKYIKPEMYALSAASFNEKLMINRIAETKKEVVIRTGGATLNEIKNVINVFKRKKIINLHFYMEFKFIQHQLMK